jgi:hypothetical protein
LAHATENNPVGAACTGPSVRTLSWRVAIGSDARGPRTALAPLLRVLPSSSRLAGSARVGRKRGTWLCNESIFGALLKLLNSNISAIESTCSAMFIDPILLLWSKSLDVKLLRNKCVSYATNHSVQTVKTPITDTRSD